MRDAFGGTFMIRIMLVFIFLFVFFIAIALNFAKAFKIKNDIINYLEENQIVLNNAALNNSNIDAAISDILKKYNYGITCKDVNVGSTGSCFGGVVLEPVEETKINGVSHYYYNVYVFINRDLGFMKALLSLTSKSDNSNMSGTWTIKGKTKVIVNG